MMEHRKNTGTAKTKRMVMRIVLLSFGLLIAQLGTALMLRSLIGSSPMATATEGISIFFDRTKGQSNILLNLMFFVVALAANKRAIGIGTLLSVFLFGFFLDFWLFLIPELPHDALYVTKILMSFLGTTLSAIGIAFYIQFHIGIGPLELMVDLIFKKTKWEYKWARYVFDGCLLLFGLMLKGTFGVGTLINLVLMGYFVQRFILLYRKKLKRMFHYLELESSPEK